MAVLDLIRQTQLFSTCSDHDLNAVSEFATSRDFADGELLFSFGDDAKELMIVSSGAVELELPLSVLGQMRSIVFESIGPGSVVGWSSLAPQGRFTLSGRAAGDTAAVAFRREDLNELFERVPNFGLEVMRNALLVATRRLRRTHQMWVSEIQQNVDQRYR